MLIFLCSDSLLTVLDELFREWRLQKVSLVYQNLPLILCQSILPVYSLTEGLSVDRFRDFIDFVLPLANEWPEMLSEEILKVRNLKKISKEGGNIRIKK